MCKEIKGFRSAIWESLLEVVRSLVVVELELVPPLKVEVMRAVLLAGSAKNPEGLVQDLDVALAVEDGLRLHQLSKEAAE